MSACLCGCQILRWLLLPVSCGGSTVGGREASWPQAQTQAPKLLFSLLGLYRGSFSISLGFSLHALGGNSGTLRIGTAESALCNGLALTSLVFFSVAVGISLSQLDICACETQAEYTS